MVKFDHLKVAQNLGAVVLFGLDAAGENLAHKFLQVASNPFELLFRLHLHNCLGRHGVLNRFQRLFLKRHLLKQNTFVLVGKLQSHLELAPLRLDRALGVLQLHWAENLAAELGAAVCVVGSGLVVGGGGCHLVGGVLGEERPNSLGHNY